VSELRHAYRDRLVALLDRVVQTQGAALDAARDAVAAALAADRLVYAVGSGHSHLLAEEVFYRAGGIAAAQAIVDPELLLHAGAWRSTRLEREEGRAARVLAGYAVGAGDVMFIASNSGRNAYPVEMALLAKARGATTIAITSMRHARQVDSRHSSGLLLYQAAELVIDNQGDYGDAALPIEGRNVRMGPTSTIAGVFILNSIIAEAVAKLARDGIQVDVYQSANMQGREGELEALIARWRPRIRGL
jgi:uncharacterized phosphosugar-binding protein